MKIDSYDPFKHYQNKKYNYSRTESAVKYLVSKAKTVKEVSNIYALAHTEKVVNTTKNIAIMDRIYDKYWPIFLTYENIFEDMIINDAPYLGVTVYPEQMWA